MLGPLLYHQKMDFAAFNYFASSLIGIKELKNILAFGTDGDKALVEAFTHNFPCAIQLHCFVHVKNNVYENLKSLGLLAPICEEFICDIFGKRVGNTFQEGLVDSSSVEEVDDCLHRFQPIWDARELSDAPVSRPRFYKYFCQYQADVVKYHMRKDLREAAGLGSPPSIFTTNAAESINAAALKRKVDYKESEWPNFNDHIKQFVEFRKGRSYKSTVWAWTVSALPGGSALWCFYSNIDENAT